MQIQKPSDLARLVKTRRQALGLTQQNVADSIGITRQSLARIESGHGGASFETVLRIFDQLDIRLEAIRGSQHQLDRSTRDKRGLHWIVSDGLASGGNGDTSALAATALRSQETGAPTGAEIDAKEARLALLSAAIEAGDPDREESTVEEEVDAREIADREGNG